jgi:hypothetical protein
MNQLMLQVDGGGSRLCGVEGGSLVEEVERCWLACGARPFGKRARPFARRARSFGEGGALVACLVGGLVISSFSFMQLTKS